MAMTADHIRATLAAYLDACPEDKERLACLSALLDDSAADLTSRKEFRGHVTAGTVLADPADRVLHIHHLALGRWLLPGGHLEPGDTSLPAAALRELTEETGIPGSAVVPVGRRPDWGRVGVPTPATWNPAASHTATAEANTLPPNSARKQARWNFA
ncbi:NUDIX hydrolase [Streptomyces hygroscopicus subsp. limoneus]|nr:NUDIX hydrolase [Streptomyces hygroscopicus subsp. limoneus]